MFLRSQSSSIASTASTQPHVNASRSNASSDASGVAHRRRTDASLNRILCGPTRRRRVRLKVYPSGGGLLGSLFFPIVGENWLFLKIVPVVRIVQHGVDPLAHVHIVDHAGFERADLERAQ